MQNTPNRPRKGAKFLDVKVFIAALALAVTIGLWNLISAGNLQAAKANPDPVTAPPPQANAQDAQGFGAIPTLVPLVEVDTTALTASQTNVSNTTASGNQPAPALRAVTAPSQTIVQKSKPVFGQSQVVVVSGGGGSSSSGGSPAVATTKSSK